MIIKMKLKCYFVSKVKICYFIQWKCESVSPSVMSYSLLTPWTVACQAPLSTKFSRQEYWRGLPFPSPGNLPDLGVKSGSPALQVDSLPSKPPKKKKKEEVAQLCSTLCDPTDCSLPGSSIHGIFQARVLEWVAVSFSRESSQPRDLTQVSCIAGRCFKLWATREALIWNDLYEMPLYDFLNRLISFCRFRTTFYSNSCHL